tara:strand:+ start:71 stop:313 length:243 start_codon:yes stop_codon:yes gene_type:complete
MPVRTQLDTHKLAVINGAQLILALEDLGFDEVEVDSVEGGFALLIGGVQIAVGIGDDPAEASEDLLDRTADLFYHNIPEA